jgi:hypothetical protein
LRFSDIAAGPACAYRRQPWWSIYSSSTSLATTRRPPLVTARARAAAEELTRRGTAVSYRRSMFVPAEETCFVLFEAQSADAAGDAAVLASLPSGRISAVHPSERPSD